MYNTQRKHFLSCMRTTEDQIIKIDMESLNAMLLDLVPIWQELADILDNPVVSDYGQWNQDIWQYGEEVFKNIDRAAERLYTTLDLDTQENKREHSAVAEWENRRNI